MFLMADGECAIFVDLRGESGLALDGGAFDDGDTNDADVGGCCSDAGTVSAIQRDARAATKRARTWRRRFFAGIRHNNSRD